MIYGPGEMDCGMAMNFGQLVADNEVISMYRAAMKGIPVNDYALAVDVIKSVGPRGQFLAEQHTFENIREQSQAKLFNRAPREYWEAAGKPRMEDKATEIAKQILAEHKPMPLPNGAAEKMADIIKEAEKRYCKKNKK